MWTLAVSLVVCLGGALPADAQAPDRSAHEQSDRSTAPSAPERDGQDPVNATDERRACDGCPPRRIGMSLLQTTGINVIYELGNLARGQVTAHITPKTW